VASSQTPEPGTWARTPRPVPSPGAPVLGRWSPTRAADITAGRLQLGAALHDGARPAGAAEGGVEGLLLAFEELVSNAVRHGRSPIEVVVTATGHCWLLEVTDAAGGTPPIPDRERDAALGGLGLGLVARLSVAHGWEPLGDGRKVVWARVDYTGDSGRGLPAAHERRASVPPGKPAIRVFLVDAHEVTRRGVATVLAVDPHIRVVGEAESVDQARRRVLAVRPDVAVVAGAQLCADLRSVLPGVRCLVLEQDVSPESVSAAIRAGASGYLVKDVRGAELVAAVLCGRRPHAVRRGEDRSVRAQRQRSPPEPADDAHRPGAPVVAAARRGTQQPRDRRAPPPGCQDGEELRQHPAGEAAPDQPHPGSGPRHPVADRRWGHAPVTRRRRCGPGAPSGVAGRARRSLGRAALASRAPPAANAKAQSSWIPGSSAAQ